jgi:hypothetical protein
MTQPPNTRQRPPKNSRRPHVKERHRSAPPPPPPPSPMSVPITLDGCHIADLVVRPGTDRATSERIAVTLYGLNAWASLGGELAALGQHRLAIAARAARAAASGGIGVSAEEQQQIARWFTGLVEEAIRRDGLRAAAAIWFVLVGDCHADPFESWPARCPVVAEVPDPPRGYASEPGESGRVTPDPATAATFLSKLRAAAASYVHTAIACASDSDILELRKIARAADNALEGYRPWGPDLVEESPSSVSLESARSMLTRRHLSNAEACSGFADWAHGFAGAVAEHALPPVFRVGAIAWFARVALRGQERAA